MQFNTGTQLCLNWQISDLSLIIYVWSHHRIHELMNIVAIISVRDEVELISANIDYHLSIGFKGIVVADILSSDGTGKKLENYKDNPKVSVVKAPSQDYEIFDWRKVLVDIAKKTYQPDFISHIDPDEFLYSPKFENLDSLDSVVFTHDQLTIRRFNCPSGLEKDFVAPARMRDMDHLNVARYPAPGAFNQKNSSDPAAWLFTQVMPKLICRSDKIERFIGGSHSAVDQFGQELQGITSSSFAFIHFPFTTYERFLRKVKNISNMMDMLVERTGEAYAYHWKRWARLYSDGGDKAILEEYQKQLAAITDSKYKECMDMAQNCIEPTGRGLDH